MCLFTYSLTKWFSVHGRYRKIDYVYLAGEKGDFSSVENILVRFWQLGRGEKKKKDILGSRMA